MVHVSDEWGTITLRGSTIENVIVYLKGTDYFWEHDFFIYGPILTKFSQHM